MVLFFSAAGASALAAASLAAAPRFASPQFASPLVLNPGLFLPATPVAIDANGDGLTDLVFADAEPNRISWLRATAAGQFSPLATFAPTLTLPIGTLAADFTGNGFADLLVVTQSERLQLLRGGSGGLSRAPLEVGIAGGQRFHSGDVDGDGDRDVVSSNSETVTVQFNGGSGQFSGSLEIYRSTPSNFTVPFALTDLDSDGRIDVVIAEPDQVRLFLGQGNGTFQEATPLSASGSLPTSLTAADLDGDGLEDLALTDLMDGSLSIFRRTGPASFMPTTGAPGGGSAPFFDRARLDAVDLDSDGDLDLVARNGLGSVDYFVNQGGGQMSARASIVESNLFSNWLPALGDVNGDGRADLFGVGFDAPDFGIATVRNASNQVSVAFDQARFEYRAPRETFTLAAGDLDGDGRQEFLSAQPDAAGEVIAYVPAGGDEFRPVSLPTTAAGGALRLESKDLDGDGLDDLIQVDSAGVLSVYRSTGGLQFSAGVSLGSVLASPSVVVLDVDLDGDLDIFAATGDSELVSYENLGVQASGALSFGPQQSAFLWTQGPLTAFETVDLNQDGSGDLAVALGGGSTGSSLIAWLPNVGGTLGSAQIIRTGNLEVTSMDFGDLDGDGEVDLAFAPLVLRDIGGARNLGGEVFDVDRLLGAVQAPISSMRLAHLDADTDLDCVVTRENGPSIPFINGGVPPLVRTGRLFPEVADVLVTDVDGDGDADVLAAQAIRRTVEFRENLAVGSVGTNYCGPAVVNSSGGAAAMYASGSSLASGEGLTLLAQGLPVDTVGIFLASQSAGVTFPVPGSSGRLCLGGSIGRYVGPGQVLASGESRTMTLDVDLGALPTPLGFVQGMPGETWHFQGWFRDFDPGAAGSRSNMTDGIAITLN